MAQRPGKRERQQRLLDNPILLEAHLVRKRGEAVAAIVRSNWGAVYRRDTLKESRAFDVSYVKGLTDRRIRVMRP